MTADYRTKLQRALRFAQDAGISQFATFPPFLRGLSAVGMPVRPLHFMSVAGLVAFLFIGMAAIFGVSYWLAVSVDVNAWALNKLRQLGPSGGLTLAAVVALLTAIIIRFQALKADLPSWRDL